MPEKGVAKLGIGIVAIILIIVVAAGAWIATQPTAPVTPTPTTTTPKPTTTTPTTTTPPAKVWKFATIFPGSILDADYNTQGLLGVWAVRDNFNIPVAYSERVAVPDAERVLREYAGLGYNIIWAHGNQFNSAVLKAAPDYPDVTFIVESDAPLPENAPKNIWNLHRNFHSGFYVLGVLAASKTETKKIGYIGGVKLAFTFAEINAVKQAINRVKPDVKLYYAWVGDFNDPTKTRILAEALIAEGVDIILGSTNLGNYGLFDAVRTAPRTVLVTTKYTDKRAMLPNNLMTDYVYDFAVSVKYVVGKILAGEKSGFTKITFGEGKSCYIKFPVNLVSPGIENIVKSAHKQVEADPNFVVENFSEPPASPW